MIFPLLYEKYIWNLLFGLARVRISEGVLYCNVVSIHLLEQWYLTGGEWRNLWWGMAFRVKNLQFIHCNILQIENKLEVEDDLRCSLSVTAPNITELADRKQANIALISLNLENLAF